MFKLVETAKVSKCNLDIIKTGINHRGSPLYKNGIFVDLQIKPVFGEMDHKTAPFIHASKRNKFYSCVLKCA